MSRDKGNPVDILKAIVDRLIAELPELCNESTCYLALDPDAVAHFAGSQMFVVSPLGGSFNEAYFEGGGQEQVTADAGVTVKIHTDLHLDHVERDTAMLTGQAVNVFESARRAMKALSGWSPAKDQNELTRDPLIPAAFNLTRTKEGVGAIELTFKLLFDWNLEA